MTPEQRTLHARAAAYARWGRTSAADRTQATAAARQAQMTQYEREVDPDGVLPPRERAERARYRQLEHMTRMTLASSRSRAGRRSA